MIHYSSNCLTTYTHYAHGFSLAQIISVVRAGYSVYEAYSNKTLVSHDLNLLLLECEGLCIFQNVITECYINHLGIT